MAQKSGMWLLEILLHIICLIFCIGVLTGCAVTISTLQDISYFEDEYTDEYDEFDNDRDRFRAVAGWLLFASIAGIVSRTLMITARGLCYVQICRTKYNVFAVMCNFYTLVLALSLTSGGSSISGNAIDVQQDYIGEIHCPDNDEYPMSIPIVNLTQCDDLERLRDAQAGAAAFAFLATAVCIATNVTVMAGLIKQKPLTDV